MFTNTNTIKKKNFSKYSKYLLIKSLKTKPDLIITPLSNTIKVLGLETKKLKIPVLCLFPDLFHNESNNKHTLYLNKHIRKFCFLMLTSILLRPIKKTKPNDFKKKKI